MSIKFNPDLLFEYDWYPRVVPAGKETEFTIRSTGGRERFHPGKSYRLVICDMESGLPKDYPTMSDFQEQSVTIESDCSLRFTAVLPKERQYEIRLYDDEDIPEVFFVYAVEEDLTMRYPFRGDTHLHTRFSDGRQTPEIVCSDYRRMGYDFLAITDHRRYYPSLRAIKFGRSIPTELCICPGEEVHIADSRGRHNDVHIINFGGDWSINAMVESVQTAEVGTAPETRSINGICPPVMNQEEYDALMDELMEQTEIPAYLDNFPAVSCKWVFEQIRKAGGLAIFAHPNWINSVYHVPEAFTDYITKEGWFDAFEVLGGESYYEQNGFQTIRYYEDKARGLHYAIVGATDSHNPLPSNRNRDVASTIVFAPENECKTLIASIKDGYSVAVDQISQPYRIVGDNRLARYAWFLLKNYYPLHDALCYEEGRLMRQYATGTAEEQQEAIEGLKLIYGRVARQRRKYFAF